MTRALNDNESISALASAPGFGAIAVLRVSGDDCHKLLSKCLIPRSGPLLFVANHQSNIAPSIVGTLVRDRPFKGIAREGLFKSKLNSFKPTKTAPATTTTSASAATNGTTANAPATN